jgi:uncharacterized protein YbjT (DUF2867 family)
MRGDPLAKDRLMWFGSPTIPITFVLTDDVAGYLADAVDVPGVEGQRIDLGWDRPVNIKGGRRAVRAAARREIRVRTIPAGLITGVSTVVGRFSPMVNDMGAMMRWFQ